jgi:uncharacterized protein YegP (UPF0339 family)
MKSKIYKDKDGTWRWETKSKGRIIGASTESYKSRKHCLKNYNTLVDANRIPLFELQQASGKMIQVW